MALVGDRNAKEYMRVASSADQMLLMATAPIGILAIMVSTIRLSGSRLLRRVTGRDSDRRSEALVELTPLSVAPASSVYTPHGVEIDPAEQKDRVAFVCAHTKQTSEVASVLTAFKTILQSRDEVLEIDRDYEIVLGMRGSELTLTETAQLIQSIRNGTAVIDESMAGRIRSASLSFRTTGISPTLSLVGSRSTKRALRQLGNVSVAIFLVILLCGIQFAGYYSSGTRLGTDNLQTLIMGLCGYCGVVLFTFGMLNMIQQEVTKEPQALSAVFSNAIWTFSDSRHSSHHHIKIPSGYSPVIGSPTVFSPAEKKRRESTTTFLCVGLVGSYVVFYLGLRVAQWWVAFSNLAVLWMMAGYRAILIENPLVPSNLPLEEHWLGVFRDNLYDSLMATVAVMESGTYIDDIPDGQTLVSTFTDMPSKPSSLQATKEKSTEALTLLVAKPVRQSLHNWSGCEDVMKVGLEMTKRIAQTHGCSYEPVDLPTSPNRNNKKSDQWLRLFRFRLMIYVPGLLWEASSTIDYAIAGDLNMPNLYRDILKIFHLSANIEGEIVTHTLHSNEVTEISHVLCGPVTVASPGSIPEKLSLAGLLCRLRDLEPLSAKAYTLEQVLLLPTIQLTALYECFRSEQHSRVNYLQSTFTDKLYLSGKEYLPTMERVFTNNGIWGRFMYPKSRTDSPQELRPRDETSGHYGTGVSNRKEDNWLRDAKYENDESGPRGLVY